MYSQEQEAEVKKVVPWISYYDVTFCLLFFKLLGGYFVDMQVCVKTVDFCGIILEVNISKEEHPNIACAFDYSSLSEAQ